MQNFPGYGSDGQLVAAGTSSAVVALAGDANRIAAAQDALLWNPGPNDVAVKFGDASAVATTQSVPLPARAIWLYRKGTATHLATISPGGAQNIVVHLGEGQ